MFLPAAVGESEKGEEVKEIKKNFEDFLSPIAGISSQLFITGKVASTLTNDYQFLLLLLLSVYLLYTMATSNTSSVFIQGMTANAVSSMKQGMNQQALHELRQAMGCLTTYLNHEEWYGSCGSVSLNSNSYDDAHAHSHVHSPQRKHQYAPSNSNSNNVAPALFSMSHTPAGMDMDSSRLEPRVNVASSSASSSSSSSGSHAHAHAPEQPNTYTCSVMYDRAFLLPLADTTIVSYAYRTQAIVVLLYNTALAHHRLGMQCNMHNGCSGKAGRNQLWNAAATYNLVLSMIGPQGLQRYPDMVVLILGLVSNLAHIHLELRQEPELKAALVILRDIMARVPSEDMSKEDYAFFQLHLFCLQREDFRYAPAA
jgi:hypothetical protein